ncbi:hypothetical protein DPMN_049777 [Dreissena polymorpha]|uniref:Uncharacterized protein n=1 Tax=Dreissena polymorpha TaxID=45954 RepID=A0A9D4CEY2_DREPO|nr:hypothetical protein DPMN_049777 [Dreissena polymorpha]
MKEEFRGSTFSAQEEVKLFKKEKNVAWHFKCNRVQWDFNEDIADSIQQIDWSIEHGKPDYCRELVADA